MLEEGLWIIEDKTRQLPKKISTAWKERDYIEDAREKDFWRSLREAGKERREEREESEKLIELQLSLRVEKQWSVCIECKDYLIDFLIFFLLEPREKLSSLISWVSWISWAFPFRERESKSSCKLERFWDMIMDLLWNWPLRIWIRCLIRSWDFWSHFKSNLVRRGAFVPLNLWPSLMPSLFYWFREPNRSRACSCRREEIVMLLK